MVESLIGTNPLTFAFSGLISIIGILFLFKPTPRSTLIFISNLLVSLGILGTFVGIVGGLYNFDTHHLEDSVPPLLEGLKFAFTSSIAGLFFSLAIKWKNHYSLSKTKNGKISGITIDDLGKYLNDINSNIEKGNKQTSEYLRKIGLALIGEEESTILTQFKNLRIEIKDEFSGLKKTLESFYEEVAENNSKALIEALNEVIKDFNAKINEQFGDNFKQLNEAVGQILEWQERYKTQMQEMIEQQNQTAENMKLAVELAGEILKQAEEISTVASNLENLLNGLERQRKNLEEHLEAFSKVADKAVTGLPKIETKIVELTDNLTRSIKSNNDEINEHLKQAVDRTEKQMVKLDQAMSEELTKALETFGKQLAALSEKFVADYTPLTDQLRNVVQIARNLPK